MSYQAYQKAQNTAETPSQVEYRLFAQVTNALMKAKDSGVRDMKLIDAVDWNRRMWSTLSSDCGAKGNSLPDQLRASIISLAIWVSKHSSLVIRGQESVDDLISINRTIMEGLAAQSQLQKQAAQASNTDQTAPTPINSIL
ncbi:flagellar biosynthesis regulator FlaF [Kordiimonas pumila]|uniref:Flagellar biosynthesis regulator FlaF n=1 Tax=Kordiimonas pumila TaxID=2161677 RepID=A0ABV7D313_9PROT|nr:flagellar biosynthesis regulator FlaF [Kordiimonas pumila]